IAGRCPTSDMGEAMKATRIIRFVLAAGLVAGIGIAQNLDVAAASTGDHDRGAIFGPPGGAPPNSGESCAPARYKTIQSAVTAAPKWATVVVCEGTYRE